MTDDQEARLRHYDGSYYPSPEDVQAAIKCIDAQAERIAALEELLRGGQELVDSLREHNEKLEALCKDMAHWYRHPPIVSELTDQRDHARHWANLMAAYSDAAYDCQMTPSDEAIEQGERYVGGETVFKAMRNTTASDGWKVGDKVS
jgi:hypothetical protein